MVRNLTEYHRATIRGTGETKANTSSCVLAAEDFFGLFNSTPAIGDLHYGQGRHERSKSPLFTKIVLTISAETSKWCAASSMSSSLGSSDFR